jgi:hypothetical protein
LGGDPPAVRGGGDGGLDNGGDEGEVGVAGFDGRFDDFASAAGIGLDFGFDDLGHLGDVELDPLFYRKGERETIRAFFRFSGFAINRRDLCKAGLQHLGRDFVTFTGGAGGDFVVKRRVAQDAEIDQGFHVLLA